MGDVDAARRHFDDAAGLSEQVGSPVLAATVASSLGYLEESVGELERAADAHRRVLALARTAHATPLLATAPRPAARARAPASCWTTPPGCATATTNRRSRWSSPTSTASRVRIDIGPAAFDAAVSRGRPTTSADYHAVL